jgi:small-conductance mechanosensitive channel/CRP-like cAMP-binding protein
MVDPDLLMNWWSTSPLYVVLVGFAGIVAWHLIPQRLSTTRLIVQIAFFLAMSILLLDGAVVPYEPTQGNETTPDAILVGAAKVLWWVHLAWALIGFVRIYLVIERKPREARLLQDLVVGVVYAGMVLSILAFVFGVPIGALIATSGVFAIILGLALQNTLSDVFSGIALNLGRPYVLGDWIVLSDGTEGRVVETNWRSTHLLTLAHNVVALPNSFLAKVGLTNVSSPDESHGLSLAVRFAPTKTPATIVDAMRSVLVSCDAILKVPAPVVAIRSLDAVAIEVELSFGVAGLNQRITARNEILDLVYRHAKSMGLRLALPASSSISVDILPSENGAGTTHFTAIELIKSIPILSALTEEEQAALAATATVRSYRKGDIIAREGEMLPSLMIVRTGVVVRQRGEDAHPNEIGHLAPGDFFGETGLLAGIGEAATLRAMSHVVVYEIDQPSFAPLLVDRPEIAEDLAAILSARMSFSNESGTLGQQNARSTFALHKAIESVFRAAPFRRVVGGREFGKKGAIHDQPTR